MINKNYMRLYTFLLILVFCVSGTLAPCGISYAQDFPDDVPGIKILANGNLPERDTVFSSAVSVTQESVYPGSDYSVKFKLSSAITMTFDTDVDWTEYSSLNIRWRADMPGQILNMVFANSDPINVKPYARIMGGPSEEWGETSIPVSRLSDYFQYSDNGCSVWILQISGSGWNNTAYDRECTVYIDGVYLKTADSGKEMSVPVSNIDGMISVNPDILGDKSVKFTFEDTLFDMDYSSIVSVTEDGEELSADSYSVEPGEKEIRILFNDLLKNNSSYKISLISPIYSRYGKVLKDDVIREFTVSYGNGFANFDSPELINGNELSVLFFAFDDTFRKEVYAYSNNGRILESAFCENDSDSVKITVPENALYVKACITDSTGSPVYFAVLDGLGKTNVSLIESSAVIEGVSQNPGTVAGVDASGKISAGDVPIMVRILSDDGSLVVCEPIAAKADGTFDYKYTFGKENLSGKYTVQFLTAGSIKEYVIAYVDEEVAVEFVEKVNSGNYNELKEWMDDNVSLIPESVSGEASIKDVAVILLENAPFDSYDALYEILVKISASVDTLNDILWSDMTDYIEENSEFLIEEDSDNYSYFISLSAKNQNLICKDITDDAPFETISEFRVSFDDAVREYKKDNSSKNTSGGSGGGSGRKTTSRTSVSVVTVPETQSPDVQMPSVTPVIQSDPYPFNDLEGFEWAKDDIIFLYSKGIISASDDNCYRPQDSIKREEIVKMIVEAFLKNANTSGHLFADAVDGAWYNPYLDTAFENGIIFGRPDGSFGIGENVSREDMAVMIYRALYALGLNSEKADTIMFSDNEDISDYAVEAVSAMAYSGVINGMSDGTFAPKDNANRAQVAKVISNILKTYEGSMTE